MSEWIPRIRVPLYNGQIAMALAAMGAGQLARGPHLDQLAGALCETFGKKYAVLTANGFSALFATLKALGAAKEPVTTTPISTCFAIVNAIKASGREIAFVDIDDSSASIGNLTPDQWAGAGSVAVVPDHFGRIGPFCRRSRRDQGVLIEDAAQAFLSRRQVRTDADAVVLSFYPTKLVNGIDGGAVLTDRPDLYEGVRRLVSYVDQDQPEPDVRFNLGMNNLNAAFALGTLGNLDALQAALAERFTALRSIVERTGLRVLEPDVGEVPSRFIVLFGNQKARDAMLLRLQNAGIDASRELLWVCAAHEHASFPAAARLVERTLSLPFHPLLTDRELKAFATAIRSD